MSTSLVPYVGRIAVAPEPVLSLTDFAKHYVKGRDVSAMYVYTLVRRAEMLEDFAGELDIRRVLMVNPVNAFLQSRKGKPHTLKSFRGDLLTLWNAAADENLVPYPNTRRIWKPKLPSLVIDCYGESEAAALVRAAIKLRGGYPNGIGRRVYWPAIIRAAWDSGLRRGDLWLFDLSAIRPDGSFRVIQHKTGKPVKRKFTWSTIDAMRAIGSQQPFAWPLDPAAFGVQFKKLTELSGVNRGSFKWLRRSAGSHVDAKHPGAGSKVLGHNDPTMFTKHYDAQLDGEVLMPPELEV